MIEAIRSAMREDGELLNESERTDLNARVDAVARIAAQNDTMPISELRNAFDALSHASEDFAARRMDKAIAKALSGQSIDNL